MTWKSIADPARLLLVLGASCLLLLGCEAASGDRSAQAASSAVTSTPSGPGRPPEAPSAAVPVEVARVRRGTIASYQQGTATLESAKTVQVLAEVAGLTRRVEVEEGDRVEPGQLLAKLDDREARLALARAKVRLAEAELACKSLVRLDQREAELALRSAELALAEARAQYQRAETMVRRGLMSQQELDTKRTQKDTAEVTLQQQRVRLRYKTIDDARFGYESAKTDLQEAELRLQYTTVQAPIAGVISQRQVVRGQYVNQHEHLFTIVDTTHLLARTFLPEKFSGRLAVGQPAVIATEALPEQRFPARVELISPVVEADSGTFKVTVALLEPPPALRPGMFASVAITMATRADTLMLPKRALTLDGQQPTVYRVRDGRARRTTLQLGLVDHDAVEVLSGLDEDDQVVVVGQEKLLDGSAVRVTTPADQAGR